MSFGDSPSGRAVFSSSNNNLNKIRKGKNLACIEHLPCTQPLAEDNISRCTPTACFMKLLLSPFHGRKIKAYSSYPFSLGHTKEISFSNHNESISMNGYN